MAEQDTTAPGPGYDRRTAATSEGSTSRLWIAGRIGGGLLLSVIIGVFSNFVAMAAWPDWQDISVWKWLVAGGLALGVFFLWWVCYPQVWFFLNGPAKLMRERRNVTRLDGASRRLALASLRKLTHTAEDTDNWFRSSGLTLPNAVMAREAYLAFLEYWGRHRRVLLEEKAEFKSVQFSTHHVWMNRFGDQVHLEQKVLWPVPFHLVLVGRAEPDAINGTDLYDAMLSMIEAGVKLFYLPVRATTATPRDFLLLTQEKQLVEWVVDGPTITSGRFLDHKTASEEGQIHIDDMDRYHHDLLGEFERYYDVPADANALKFALDSEGSLEHFCKTGEPRSEQLLLDRSA